MPPPLVEAGTDKCNNFLLKRLPVPFDFAGGAEFEPHLPFGADRAEIPEGGIWIVKLLADSGLCKSNGDARRLIQGGGAYLGDKRIDSIDYTVTAADFPDGSALLKAGKKNIKRIVPA